MRLRKALLIGGLLLLAGCGGGSSTTLACDSDYWDGTVGTCLPKGWQVLDSETLRQRGVPEETIAAFQREAAISGQFPTVAVTKEPLADPVTPVQYSDANIRSVQVLDAYKQIDNKDFTVDGVKVKMDIFTAQPVQGEPQRRFYQVSTTVKDVGYTFTGVAPQSIDAATEKEILLMFQKMTFKEAVKK